MSRLQNRSVQFALIGALTAGICFLVGYVGSLEMPKVQHWALVKVEQVSHDFLPVLILPAAIDINFFPMGATLHQVKISPKEELQPLLDPLEIESVDITLSPWQLLQGRLRLASVEVKGASISVRVPATKKKSEKPLDGLFDILAQVPINRLSLEDISVKAVLKEPDLIVEAQSIELNAEKKRNSFGLTIESASLRAIDPETHADVRADLEADVSANRTSATISALKIRRGDSFLVASGQLQGETEALDFKDASGSLRAELQLESMRNWLVKTFPKLKEIPLLKGRGFIEVDATRAHGHEPDGNVVLRTEGLMIEKILLDRISTKGTYRQGVVHLPEATMQSSGGAAKVKDIIIHKGDVTTVEGHLLVDQIQLKDLLSSFSLPKVPTYVSFGGDMPCHGEFTPKFWLTCNGKMHGEDFVLRDSVGSPSIIVGAKSFSAEGQVTIDPDKVTYSAELAMPDSKGRSQGSIDYDHGFNISYEADRLSIKDLTNLVGLKLEGVAKVKGTTQGNSDTGTADLQIDASDVWLEDYWLGNVKGGISYKDGTVNFTGLEGYYTVSRYNGDLKLDVRKKQISLLGHIPFFDTRDLLKVFSRRVKLPFSVTGTGQAQIKLSGPLEFNHLSYELKSSIFRGSVAGESFDQATYDVSSVGGEVKTDKVSINKGTASATLTGVAHPDASVAAVVHGRGIHLEDTAVIANSGLSLSGLVDFDMDLKGYILKPDTTLHGTLTKTSLGEQAMPDSNFKMKFTSKTLEGSGDFLGNVVKADVVLPLDATAPFRLKLTTTGWNFAPIFTAIAGPDGRKDFEGKLTSAIDIQSANGGFWNATGTAKFPELSLSHGTITIHNDQPIAMQMKDGRVHIQNFNMVGDNTFLKVVDRPEGTAKLDLQANGKLDLNLFGLFLPFFEDLRGILSFTFNIRGGSQPAELLGSVYVDKGYIKFFDFPHPLENIRADVLFNQTKLLFNTLKAELGGGVIEATGEMQLKGYKNYPLNVTGTFDKVTLNVPDKVKTTGSGDLAISGSWFPFLMKGNYEVHDGLFTKEFGGDNAQGDSIHRDFYLPDFLLQESFSPLLMDLHIGFKHGIDMKNEYVEGKVLGELQVTGQPGKPVLTGTVTTDKDTKMFFKDTSFEVTTANVEFTGGTEINPKLYVTARARVQDYDINLLVQGFGKAPAFSLTSVPPLEQKEIISLLALGATDTALDKTITSGSQAQNTGLQVGSGIIKNNPITDVIKDKLGFQVQFSPGFDDTTNTATQKVIAKRQFNSDVGMSVSHSFGEIDETDAQLHYRLDEKFSLIGSWTGHDQSETINSTETTPQLQINQNTIGLDLQYKFEFK